MPSTQVTVHSTGDGGLPGPGSKLNWTVFKGCDLSQYANWGGHLGFFASPAAGGGQSSVVGVQLLDSAGHLIAQAGSVP